MEFSEWTPVPQRGSADGGDHTSRSLRRVRGSASLPGSGPDLSKALRTSSALPRSWGHRSGSSRMWVCSAADTDGVEGGVTPLRGVSELVTGADGFGLRATDGGLRPPPPSSVEPSGIPAGPTVDPGPMDEAKGADAAADAAQVVGAVVALMPPPSKSVLLDSPLIGLAVPADVPVVKPPIPADAPVIGLPMPADAGTDEAPAHVAPITGDAPDVIGLTPGVASSVAPRGIPVCPTGAFGMPSGDVMPSAGRGETFMRACAWAEAQPKRTAAVATAKRVIIATTFFHLGIRGEPPGEAKPTKM